MTFLREFEEDIFISYAHLDDQPLAEGQRGWITSFYGALKVRLPQLLGEELKLWWDEAKLRGNDNFHDAIVIQLPRVAVLVTVITPRYVKSDWCMKEVEEFCKFAEQTGGIQIDESKARIFKVVKTPIPLEKHPPQLQMLRGYEFYQIDPTTGKLREYIFNSGPNTDINYWAKLEDLAQDICQLLEMLREGKDVPMQARLPPAMTVYLAETTYDLSLERDQIKRDLQQRGYRVLPESPLPLHAEDFKQAVRKCLEQSQLSVHLIGANYGVIPEAADRSVVCLQHDLATERSLDQNFSRIIWLSKQTQVKEERQQQFIEYLQNDSAAQHGAELLQNTPLEDLKTIIHDKLRPAPPAVTKAAEVVESYSSPLNIYLICDRQDLDDITPLSDYLFDQGFEVITPAMQGDEAQVSADHIEHLRICDAILIYHGHAGELWLRAMLLNLRKIAGYGRTTPLLAKAIYVAAPATPEKERFRTHEAMVIKNPARFSPESLQPFLTQIEKAKGARS